MAPAPTTLAEQPVTEISSPDSTGAETLDQARLVARCQLGDPAAFDDLVARFHEPLWHYVRRTAGDLSMAEDVIQDGWLRILRGIGRLREPDKLRPWLFGIVRRALMDRLRARYAHDVHEPLAAEPADSRDPEPLADDEDLARLEAAVDALPPADREATVLFYLQGLDLREVAQIQEIPVGTVKSRLHRARRLLRERLAAPGVTR